MTHSYSSWDEILIAAKQVITEAQTRRIDPHHLAENKREAAIKAGHREEARLWRDVWVHLMTKRYAGAVNQNRAA